MSDAVLLTALRRHAAERPDAPAITFVRPAHDLTWTYAELAAAVGGIAAAVRAQVAPGERVLVLHPQGPDLIAALLGCMEAGVLAVPLQPPQAHRPQLVVPKLEAIAADGGVALATTTAAKVAETAALLAGSALADLSWLGTDTCPPQPLEPELRAAEIAYLQYTSGSTSTPKGVVVTHDNLAVNLATFDQDYGHDGDSVMVSWLPAFHDLGLVYGVFLPLWKGFRTVLLDPVDFLRRPVRWLDAISRYRGTHAPAPNFAFDLCAAKVSAADRAALDLSSWKVALNGAEPIRADTEERFLDAFGAVGFSWTTLSHAYGMSESTAVISKEPVGTQPTFVDVDADALERHEVVVVPPSHASARRLAVCGVTTPPTRVIAVDPDTLAVCGPDRVGELWVGGPTVAVGYWQQPDATEATFRARTADGDGPWLRTGDLGFVRDGAVTVTGRLKDLIIVRGANHYPQDLEWSAQTAHPAVRPSCVAAFARTEDADDVTVVAEVYPDLADEPERVVTAVREAVTAHGVRVATVALVEPKAIGKTSSGKLMRRHTRAALADGTLRPLFRWDAPSAAATPGGGEDWLAVVRGAVGAQLGVDAAQVDADTPLRELGLDSLQSVALAEALSEQVGRTLPDTLVFDHPTVRALARHLGGATAAPTPGRPTEPEDDGLDDLDAEALARLLRAELDEG